MVERVGEVIESRSTEFVAQCYRLHEPPALGSLVRVRKDEIDILAVVSDASTGPMQPGRSPVARGLDEATEEDLYAHNPQLDKLLRSLFQAQIVGYAPVPGGDGARPEGTARHRLPPRPPQIHAFVYRCEGEELSGFCHSFDFLTILIRASVPAGDQVISACLSLLSQGHEDPRQYLVRAGKELSLMLAGEPQRLNALLKGLRP